MFIEEAKTQNNSVRRGIKWKLTQPHELSTERWHPKSFQRSMIPTCYTPLYYCIVFSAFVFFPPCIFRFPVLDYLYDPIGLSVASSNPIPGYPCLRCGPDHALGRCVARGPYLAWCGGTLPPYLCQAKQWYRCRALFSLGFPASKALPSTSRHFQYSFAARQQVFSGEFFFFCDKSEYVLHDATIIHYMQLELQSATNDR